MTLALGIADPAWLSPPVRNSLRKPAKILLNLDYVNGSAPQGCGQHNIVWRGSREVAPFWLHFACKLFSVARGANIQHLRDKPSAPRRGYVIKYPVDLIVGQSGRVAAVHHCGTKGIRLVRALAEGSLGDCFGRFYRGYCIAFRRNDQASLPSGKRDGILVFRRRCGLHQHQSPDHSIPLTSRVARGPYIIAAHHA